jgi:hypothetical protein
VASTKAFTSQVTVLALLTLMLGRQRQMSREAGIGLAGEMQAIPSKIQRILDDGDTVRRIAEEYQHHNNFIYLGSIDYILSDSQSVGIEGRFGFNTWDDWDDLDSNSFYLLATAGGRLGNGIYYHAVAGWEWWTYDEDDFIDDRDDFYAELKISGEVTDQFYLAGGLTYGIDTVQPGRYFESADPNGLKMALTGVWDNGLYSVAGLATYTMYEADVISNADGHWNRWSAGLSFDRAIGANSRAGIAFEYAGIDTHTDDFDDVETTVRWTSNF